MASAGVEVQSGTVALILMTPASALAASVGSDLPPCLATAILRIIGQSFSYRGIAWIDTDEVVKR
jgi:hypothetical protein